MTGRPPLVLFFVHVDAPPIASSPRVAVIEDDVDLRRDLVDYLAVKGFDVVAAHASAESFLSADEPSLDLVIIDVGLPGRDGLSLLGVLKARPSCPGVVVLTAYGSDDDHLRGLAAGADAYVVKNRSLPVVEATCRSVLRRRSDAAAEWALDEGAGVLRSPGGGRVELTHQESVFLRCVFHAAGGVASRETVLESMGKSSTLSNLRNLDNCVARLRRKVLAEVGLDLPVRAAYGEGYVFRRDA